MLKKSLVVLLFMGLIPAYAGQVEDAINKKQNVFLYLYTQNCGYCKKFTPRYEVLAKNFGDKYKFIKLDADTPYGRNLLWKYKGNYVPYVMVMNSEHGFSVSPSCLMDNACVETVLKRF